MTPERWQRVKEILESSLELPQVRRAAYLDEVCSDPELRREVETLIASHEAAGDVFEARTDPGTERQEDGMVGRRIGPYRLIEEIGEGGMGTVYRAVRADDTFRKQVAIKVVKPGTDHEFIVKRFRRERQILAGLEHPNIAQLFDGGTTDDGLPYFVMEFIHGKPISVYCDAERLSTNERLRLFCRVCAAVQYAHDRGVIHRDIKPANILITREGEPKLLDFGIAKILNPEFSTQPLDATATVVRLMTPEYASPEQIRGEPVTRASDIYSLGVLLYELLTGHRPYRFLSRSPHDIARAVCESEPGKPSTAIGQVQEIARSDGTTETVTPEVVSQARSSRPDRLRRALAGDLDNIVLMAMRKEPSRRYASAAEFAEDLVRHLEGRPVKARRPSLLYRASKFVGRHSWAMAAAAATLAVVAGAVLFQRYWLQERSSGAPPRLVPLTSYSNDETQPVFSPDGREVAFVWNGEQASNADVYVKPLDGAPQRRLTTSSADEVSPIWSPDGQRIAFLRQGKEETAIFLSPAGGGTHEKLVDVWPARQDAVGRQMAWSPDGRFIAIPDRASLQEPFRLVLVDTRTRERRAVTSPPQNWIGDSAPAFSRDGKYFSFIRARSSGVNDVYVQPAAGGEARRLTSDNRYIISQTWTPDSRSILFSSNRAGGYLLWHLPVAGGEPRRVLSIGQNAADPSFAADGRKVAYSLAISDANIWRLEVAAGRALGAPRMVIASSLYDSSPQYSPDGNRVAFRSNRDGSHEIWVTDADGRNAYRLTDFDGPLTGTPRWSPDGQWVAFDTRPEGQADIWVAPAGGGAPRRLTVDNAEDVVPSWSRDGHWVYFASNRAGTWQVWKIPAGGGQAQQVTKGGGFAAFESPDGKFLYYARSRSAAGLWRTPLGGGPETPVLDLKAGYWGYWAIDREGIYYVEPAGGEIPARILYYNLRTHRSSLVLALDKQPVVADSAFALSPDGGTILYSQIDHAGGDIMVLENFPELQ